MGLLDKTNPMATRKSVIRWAIYGAIAAPIMFSLRRKPLPRRYSLPILIAAAVGGAALGALMEWQLDDGEEGEKVAEVFPPAGVWDRDLDHDYPASRRDA